MGYQRKRVEELDDPRLKFEISTIIPREGLEICLLSGIERPDAVKFAVPLLDLDLSNILVGYPLKHRLQIFLQVIFPVRKRQSEMPSSPQLKLVASKTLKELFDIEDVTLPVWVDGMCMAEYIPNLEENLRAQVSEAIASVNSRRIIGRGPLNEDEFEEVAQGTFLKDDDISSISGSDEESDDPITCGWQTQTESVNRSMNMKNQILISLQSGEIVSIWRNLFLGDREDLLPEHNNSMVKENDAKGLALADKEVIARLQSLVKESRDQKNLRVVLLASGGHFAGCVFDGNNILSHKTYHRYVVRANAGGRQSSKDSTRRAPKSGGASLRRYNEMALKKAEKDAKRKLKQRR